MSPAVSVVLPVLDGERWLDEALDSIAAQTLAPAQVVVVDDGSRDRSRDLALARSFTTVIDGPRAGIAAAYEAGIAACTGDAVGFLGQDDRFAPVALERLAGALQAKPAAGLACGCVQLFSDEATPFNGLRDDRLDRPYRARVPEAVLIRRELLLEIGIDVAAGKGWDVDLFLRLDEAGAEMAVVDELVVHKRLRPDSAIHAGTGTSAEILTALRRSLVRRRTSAEEHP